MLRDEGFEGWHFGFETNHVEKMYGSALVTRQGIKPLSWSRAFLAPWPQLLCAAEVDETIVISVHIPNGSGNGWK
jgi:hypothetical protein